VDRLWHFKRLGNLANYDETWDAFHTCYGHNPRNSQPFKNLFSASGAGSTAGAAATGVAEATPSRHRRLLTPTEFDADATTTTADASADATEKSGKAPASLMTDKSGTEGLYNKDPDHYYTNMELYEYLHPNNRFLQYVYDSFDWDHCDQQGYEMYNTW
jgi:hypothetical protein